MRISYLLLILAACCLLFLKCQVTQEIGRIQYSFVAEHFDFREGTESGFVSSGRDSFITDSRYHSFHLPDYSSESQERVSSLQFRPLEEIAQTCKEGISVPDTGDPKARRKKKGRDTATKSSPVIDSLEAGGQIDPKKPKSDDAEIAALIGGTLVVMIVLILAALALIGYFIMKAIEDMFAACYIATMVYGSYDAPEVLVLRRFRDEKLIPTRAGRLFVRFYYFTSPKLVLLLRNNRLANRAIRFVLDAWVRRLKIQQNQASTIEKQPFVAQS